MARKTERQNGIRTMILTRRLKENSLTGVRHIFRDQITGSKVVGWENAQTLKIKKIERVYLHTNLYFISSLSELFKKIICKFLKY